MYGPCHTEPLFGMDNQGFGPAPNHAPARPRAMAPPWRGEDSR